MYLLHECKGHSSCYNHTIDLIKEIIDQLYFVMYFGTIYHREKKSIK